MASEQNATWTESVDKSTKTDRLCTAVQFLLNCFGSMHHLKMTKSICFVLEDVRTFLLGMNSTSRMEAFSNLPSIMMDDLGFLKKKASTRLDMTIVTKDELLLLFVVCHLSLNGKSHFEEIVKGLKNWAPVINMVLSCNDASGRRREYFNKYPQYFQLDSKGYLELDSTFFLPFRECSNFHAPSKIDGFLKCEGSTVLPNSNSQVNCLSSSSKESKTMIPGTKCEKELSKIYTERDASSDASLKNREMTVINKIKPCVSNESVSAANMRKFHLKAKASEDRDSSLRKSDVFSRAFQGKTVSESEHLVHQITANTSLQIADRICNVVRKGMVFLFEHFKCRLDLHLVCVVLHALHEAKCSFLLLSQSEQVALVKKILEPLWIAGVEDNSGTFLRPSSEAFGLNKEQRNLLFISYVVSQSENLQYSTLLEKFKEYKMDITELMQKGVYFKYKRDFFFVDEAECIKFENFPPAKWMAERFSTVTSFSQDLYSTFIPSETANDIAKSFSDLAFSQTGMSKTVPKNALRERYLKKGDILVRDQSLKKNASKTKNVVDQSTVETAPHIADRICTIVREGIVFLFEHFNCRIDLRLVCVVLHVLHEAKHPFLWLVQHEQIALVKKIISPLWIAGVEDNKGTFLRPSLETFELSNEQRNLLFISYAVSQSEKMNHRTLLGMFEKHRIDVIDFKQVDVYFKHRKDFFSIDEAEFIKFENFPPAKWMAQHLSSVPTFSQDSSSSTSIIRSGTSEMANDITISFGNLSFDQPRISETVPAGNVTVGEGNTEKDAKETIEGTRAKNVSRHFHDTLDYLSERIHDCILYLMQFFEVNIYSGLLEVVLHVAKDCVLFFGLSFQNQVEVILRSFRAFRIDGHGRVICILATNQNEIKLTKKVRRLLCMTYIVNRISNVHYQVLFTIYHAYIGRTKYWKDVDQYEYFRERDDIFFVSSTGHVSLTNVSTIKFNYVSFLILGTIHVPGKNPSSIIFNQGAVIPKINFRPPIFNSNVFVPRLIYNPRASAVVPRMNFGEVIVDTGALIPATNCCPVLNSGVDKNINTAFYYRPIAQNEVDADKGKTATEEENSLARADSLSQHENVSMSQYSNYKVRTLNVTDEEEEAKRVTDGILYLSQYFVIDADDLTLIFCVLEDVKSYILRLALRARDDFVKKCVSHLFASSSGSASCATVTSDSCTLNDEEKIALFIALLLSREKELHYTQIFDKLLHYNATKLSCVSCVLHQYNLVTKWKHVFSMTPDGNVKLLPILTNETNYSVDGNDDFKFETEGCKLEHYRGNAEDCDKAISRSSAPIFNLLEPSSDNASRAVSANTPSIDCCCTKDSTKERRTINFLTVILSQSKVGFPVSVLTEKLSLASSEVKHYLACVYKGNLLNFLRSHEKFYISPTSDIVCCKI